MFELKEVFNKKLLEIKINFPSIRYRTLQLKKNEEEQEKFKTKLHYRFEQIFFLGYHTHVRV